MLNNSFVYHHVFIPDESITHMSSFFDDVVVLNALWVAYVPSAVTKRCTDPVADCISGHEMTTLLYYKHKY